MILLDNIIGIVIKGLYYTLKTFILFIIILLYIFENYNSNKLLVISFLFYLICTFISKKIIKHKEVRKKNNKIILLCLIVVSTGLSKYAFCFMPVEIYVLGAIYFLYFSIIAFRSNLEKEFLSDELRNATIILVLSISLILFAKLMSDKNIPILYNHLILYFLTSVIYISRINLNKEYSLIDYDTINKKKNIPLFNSITIILIFVLYFSRNFIKTLIKVISLYIVPIIYKIFYFVLYLFAFVFDKLFAPLLRKVNLEKLFGDRANDQMKFDIDTTSNETAIQVIEFIVTIVFFVIILIIIVKIIKEIYKTITNYYLKHFKTEDYEEKEFILENNILKKIKERLINILNKNVDENVHPIRKRYKEAAIEFIKRGYKYKKSTTPNEYINQISKEEICELNFKNITDEYNNYRYGKNN